MLSKLFKSIFGTRATPDLKSLISNGALLVDVRNPDEFKSGHVKNSINVPLDQVAQKINLFKGKSNIIVFCRSGNRSRMAKSILATNGVTNVINGGSWENIKQYVN